MCLTVGHLSMSYNTTVKVTEDMLLTSNVSTGETVGGVSFNPGVNPNLDLIRVYNFLAINPQSETFSV